MQRPVVVGSRSDRRHRLGPRRASRRGAGLALLAGWLLGGWSLAVGRPAVASRAPAAPLWAGAPDGRTYLLVNPDEEGRTGVAIHVRRRDGAPPAAAPAPTGDRRVALAPLEGDTVLSRGEVAFPMEAWCLDGAAGYLLIDEFARPGAGRLLERRGPEGRAAFRLAADAMFTPTERARLPRLFGDHVHWQRGWWIGAAGDDLVVATTVGSVLRVRLADGASSRDPDAGATVVARLTRAATAPTFSFRQALEWAREARPAALAAALETVLPRADLDAFLRLDVASVRLELGASAAAQAVLVDAVAPARPDDVRALALDRLVYRVLPAADAALRTALRDALLSVDSPEARLAVRALADGEAR